MLHSAGRPEQYSSILQPLRPLSGRFQLGFPECPWGNLSPTWANSQRTCRPGLWFATIFLIYCNHNYIISSFLFLPPYTPSCSLSNSLSLLLISYYVMYINIYSYIHKYNLLSLYVPCTCFQGCPFGMNNWCALSWLRLFPRLSALLSCLGSLCRVEASVVSPTPQIDFGITIVLVQHMLRQSCWWGFMGVAGQSRRHGLTARFAYYSFKEKFSTVWVTGWGWGSSWQLFPMLLTLKTSLLHTSV